jgi:hypothetical protein
MSWFLSDLEHTDTHGTNVLNCGYLCNSLGYFLCYIYNP